MLPALQINAQQAKISGKVTDHNNKAADFVTVSLKNTGYGCVTDGEGFYSVAAPPGSYVLVASAIEYETAEKPVHLAGGKEMKLNIVISPKTTELDEVVVVSDGISRLKHSAYNVIAIDTKSLVNSTQSLTEALALAPGVKIRESGGVGSESHLMIDGFGGKHVKVFIDGVPQEGVGSSFAINNIPANYASRIEIYKGVTPVGFGTDAIGGVINIITNKNLNKWFTDASYSYGSFNTHKLYMHFGQTFNSGLMYEINAFANYSDNDYFVDTPVKDFQTGAINKKKIERVRRFHDNYRNEAVVAKVGFVNRKWADRMMFGIVGSDMYKEIQTGVRQEIVFGGKYRKGYSLMPSLEYRKRDVFVKGLDVASTVNFNKNITNNVDTSVYEYNWRGEMRLLRLPGEQSYQHIRSYNDNWNGTLTVNFLPARGHNLVLNYVMNSFTRTNREMLSNAGKDAVAKETRKSVGGLSYRLMTSARWNASVFGKFYKQFIAGPIATSAAQDRFARTSSSIDAFGYGVAGTYFIRKELQAKFSYEKAYRLPSIEEVFGDEDLETGHIGIKPENSDNINLSLSCHKKIGGHSIYVEGGLIYRNSKDYIQRKLINIGGGKSGAAYENHGSVLTKGYNVAACYGFGGWVSIGGNYTLINARDNVKTVSGGSNQESLTYGARMPNVPYSFANSDVAFNWRGVLKKDHSLTIKYDNFYVHKFSLYSEVLGSESHFYVPTQFSHNMSVAYSINNGRFNFSLECRNLTNEKLYDNFSLQKAGRAFYGKVRVYFTDKY